MTYRNSKHFVPIAIVPVALRLVNNYVRHVIICLQKQAALEGGKLNLFINY